MDSFTPTFANEAREQQSEYVAAQGNNVMYQFLPNDSNAVFVGPHLQVIQPMNTMFFHPSGQAHFFYTAPALVPQLSSHPRQLENLSSFSHQTNPFLPRQWNASGIQDAYEHQRKLSTYHSSPDKVMKPSEMPIGSLVHAKEPPKWGVVKISNIPYAITKQEIFQFVGHQARLISPTKGCPIHIIMERSTAKTMDCYVEFETPAHAKEAVIRINKIYESGRAPRLGSRHVDVELSDQDTLLKDLFPRTKCIVWQCGMPFALANTDPYSTGFMGFFTSEEIIGAIRHAEIPHRSPFCDKCPQRTYESTISTLYKFPWYAIELYTVHDRNQLFELTNRHIISLVARINRSNTVGLDHKLLLDLLRAGLSCPAFNERQKYTLCINSEEITEILKFPEIGKWFPFDTLVKIPGFNEDVHLYYANLISKGVFPEMGNSDLPNNFPSNIGLHSPYGKIWLEWPLAVAKSCTWDHAVRQEMAILTHLVKSGWTNNNNNNTQDDLKLEGNATNPSPTASHIGLGRVPISPSSMKKGHVRAESASCLDLFATPSLRASYSKRYVSGSCWNEKLLLDPSSVHRPRFPGHRITQSSPNCFPSPTNH